jgi:hypothetical protein
LSAKALDAEVHVSVIKRSYAGNKQKPHKMSAIMEKANPDTENLRALNLVAVKLTTVQVFRLLL